MEHELSAIVDDKETGDNTVKVESSSENPGPAVSPSPITPTLATDTSEHFPSSGLNEAPSSSLKMVVDETIADATDKSESSVNNLSVQPPKVSGDNDNQPQDVLKDDRSPTTVPEAENNNTIKPNSESYISDNSLSGMKRLGHSSEKYLLTDEMKFMANFDPTQRMDRKRSKRYTESGIVVERCDCLIPTCPGCHFPCKHCGGNLCGHTCRKGREWDYEEIEIQGQRIIRRPADDNEVK